MNNFADQLTEERIRPREPGSSEPRRIVLVVALMHVTGVRRRTLQHPDRANDLKIGVAGKRKDNLRHRPDHVAPNVRPADTFTRSALIEPRIFLAPHEASRTPI